MTRKQVQDIHTALFGCDNERYKLSLINHINKEISEFEVTGFRVRLKLAQFLGWSDEKLKNLDIVIEESER